MPANLEYSAVATGLENVSFHSNPKERQCQKCSNYHTVALFSYASKGMLKFSCHSSTVCEPLDLEKAEEPEIKLPTSTGSLKKQETSRKTSTSALFTTPKKPLTVWMTTNCGKFLKRRDYQATWPASWEICMQVKKQQLGLDMEQQTGSMRKEYFQAIYCHPAYLTYIQSTSWEMLD